MKKEYKKFTSQLVNENMEPIGELKETVAVSLIADTAKRIKDKRSGITCVRVDLGTGDSEENYEEIDDPVYTKVIDNLIEEVSNNDL